MRAVLAASRARQHRRGARGKAAAAAPVVLGACHAVSACVGTVDSTAITIADAWRMRRAARAGYACGGDLRRHRLALALTLALAALALIHRFGGTGAKAAGAPTRAKAATVSARSAR